MAAVVTVKYTVKNFLQNWFIVNTPFVSVLVYIVPSDNTKQHGRHDEIKGPISAESAGIERTNAKASPV